MDTAAVGKLYTNTIGWDSLTATVSQLVGDDGKKSVIPEEKIESKGVESSLGHSSREAHQKPNKRNSIFGNLFGKKESPSPGAKDFATTTSSKGSDPTAVSATAPRLEDPITTGSSEPSTTAPASTTAADTTETSALVDSPSVPATSPEPGKEKRRSSFFGNLGTKREKRTDVTSDADIPDGEGKKSTPAKFGGLFRKPSRVASSGNRSGNNATSPTPNVPESIESPVSGGKDVPADTGDAGATPEPATGPAQHTPVSATA